MKCYITITCATENTYLVGRFAQREKIAHNTYLPYRLLSATRKWWDRWRTVTLWGKPCPSQSLWSSETRFTFVWLRANSLPLSWWLTKPFLYFLRSCWKEPSKKGPTSYLVCKSRSTAATSPSPESNCHLDLDVPPTCDKSSRCEILGEEGGDRAQRQKDTTICWSAVNWASSEHCV